jgi:hypothetical protein
MSTEYIKQLEETIDRMKKEMENLHDEKDLIEEKWRTHAMYDESELWSLDMTMAEFIYPRLLRLKEMKNGHPSEIEAEEWEVIFNKILKSFETIVKDERYPNGYDRNLQGEVSEGLALFGKWFQSFWD